MYSLWFTGRNARIFSLLVVCAMTFGCATSSQTEKIVVENQNNISELSTRYMHLEKKVVEIDQEVQQANSRVYEVRNKSGRKTGMTAHPIAPKAPAPSASPTTAQVSTNTMPPVVYASPMTDKKNAGQAQASQPSAPVVTPQAAPVSSAPQVAPQVVAQTPQTSPGRAPLGTLDPNSKLILPENHNASHVPSLPPESTLYPPSATHNQAALPPTGMAPQQGGAPSIMQPVTPQVATAPAVQTPQSSPPPVQRVNPAPAVQGEKGAYKQALDLVLKGQAAQGRDTFNAFLQQYPQSSLTPNAYYWIGESYYSQGNFPDALLAFKQVTTNYPKHHKTSDALLKAGMTYEKLGDGDNAQLQYQALLADFPNSNAAKIARNKRR